MRPDLAAVIARAAHAGPEPSERAVEAALMHWTGVVQMSEKLATDAASNEASARYVVALALALDAFAARALDAEAAAGRELLVLARQWIAAGNWANGVTAPGGMYDEGEMQAANFMQAIDDYLSPPIEGTAVARPSGGGA